MTLGVVVAYVLYVAAGFWLLPGWLKGQMTGRLASEIGRTIEVEQVKFNPFRLALEMEGFHLKELDGKDFLGWKKLSIDFSVASLWRGEWLFSTVAVEELHGQWVVGPDGRMNFADIQARLGPPAPAGSKPPRPLVVETLSLGVKRLVYADQSLESPFVTSFGPVSLNLKNFHTSSASLSAGEFSAQTEAGEEFHWRGGVSLAPLASQGHIDIKAFSLPKHAPFYSRLVPFAITSGEVAASIAYEVSFPEGKLAYTLREGQAAVTKLQLAPRGGGAPWVVLDRVTASGLSGSSAGPSFSLDRLEVAGGSIEVNKDARGLNLARWLPSSSPTAPAPSGPAPTVQVGEVALSGLGIQYSDTTLGTPVKLRFPSLQANLQQLNSAALEKDLPFTFRTGVGPEGTIEASGTLALAPVSAKAAIQVKNFDLAPWSGYLEQVLPYAIETGRLQADLDVALALPAGSDPLVGAKASMAVEGFALARASEGTPLARWEKLAVKGVEATTQPTLRLVVGSVEVSQPVVSVQLDPAGQLNWMPPSSVSSVEAPAEKDRATQLPSVAVDEVVLRQGRVEFQDNGITPQVRLALSALEGKVNGLSSASLARADVDLTGKFDGGAPFSVKGQVNPLSDDVYSDVAVNLRGLDLLPASPYAARYVGRELARGNASLEFKVRVSRQALAVTPVLTLDQLTLGKAVKSPQATSLPVSLAIALLKDANGRIQLQVPIEGRLDDPQFRILPIVWGVVGNLLEKAAKAPFALLGSMFGGGGDELGIVDFAPGEIALSEKGIQKMDTIARALRERPALSLDMVGGFAVEQDRPVLQARALAAELRQTLWEELRRTQTAETIPAPGALVLTPEAESRLVLLRYQARFGTSSSPAGTKAPTTPGAGPAVSPSSPNASEKPGLLRRLVRFLAGPPESPSSSTPAPSLPKTAPASTTMAGNGEEPAVTLTEEEMRRRLQEAIVIDDSALQFLADDRAQAVRAHLIEVGQISPERLFLVPGRSGNTRVELTLK